MINNKKRVYKYLCLATMAILYTACVPTLVRKTENNKVSASYGNSQDTVNTGKIRWKEFFTDPYLNALIDTALKNNQELNIVLQEIVIAKNEVRARKGEYLPFLGVNAGAGISREGKYTRFGAVDANSRLNAGLEIPEPLPDFYLSTNISWEADIWKKLRNAKKSAMHRYLASSEGRNFMVTQLIAEIAGSYYELMALDNQVEILKKNIDIQQNALEIVRQQKNAAKSTELAVKRFEAEVAKNQSRMFYIIQQITETENHINFLVGRFPQTVQRNSQAFTSIVPDSIHAGIPSQLLENRPDIKQAEQELAAAKLDIKVAKANFYPSLRINAGLGYQAFNPKFLLNTPESVLYNVAGDVVAPVINRNAIKAFYYSANARQVEAVYNYERRILIAYIEVANQIANISNLKKSYDWKAQQADALTQSITISGNLFKSVRADYTEVLLTQRDALESKFELIEIKKHQMQAMVNIYQALGGGWR